MGRCTGPETAGGARIEYGQVSVKAAVQAKPLEAYHLWLKYADGVESEVDLSDWQRLTSEQFLSGYADADSIYDDLPTG